MEKAVGSVVTIVRTNPATGAETREQARVLAANGGIVLQIGNRIEVLRDDGLPVRVIFDKVPENLRARPTLSVTLEAANAGPRAGDAHLSHPRPRLDQRLCDAVRRGQGRDRHAGLGDAHQQHRHHFRSADVLLVAGNPNGAAMAGCRQLGDSTIEQAGTETSTREKLGDYYLYPLGERTTIANAQQKQVSFLDVKNTPARKTYEWANGWLETQSEPRSAATVLKFSTSKSGGLGDQLPSGTMRVYMRDARGDPQFIGESRVRRTRRWVRRCRSAPAKRSM